MANQLTQEQIDASESMVFEYLETLRDSGVTNMFGAGIYLEEEFGFDSTEARAWLTRWMTAAIG